MNESILAALREHYSLPGGIRSWKILREKKTDTSAVAEVVLRFEGGEKTVFLKSFSGTGRKGSGVEALRREYEALARLSDRLSGRNALNLIKPVTYIEEEGVLVTEAFAGTGLNELIRKQSRGWPSESGRNKSEREVFLTGQWLRAFQESTAEGPIRTLTREAFLLPVKEMMKILGHFGLERPFEAAVLDCFDRGFQAVGPIEMKRAGCHNDFTPQNILVGTDGVAVVDFARYHSDFPYEDPALFLVALEGYKSIVGMSAGIVDRLKEAFLNGYGKGNLSEPVLRLFVLKNILKVLTWIPPGLGEVRGFLSERVRKSRGKRRLRVYFQYMDRIFRSSSGV